MAAAWVPTAHFHDAVMASRTTAGPVAWRLCDKEQSWPACTTQTSLVIEKDRDKLLCHLMGT